MKFRHLFFALLATGLVAACNNDDITVDNVENQNTEGEAFIALKVALPSSVSPTTRDGQGSPNDDFNDGIAAEYDVNNVTVVVFDKDTDDAVAQVVVTPAIEWTTPDETQGNITISSTDFLYGDKGVEVGSDPIRYVLVIANHNGQLQPQVGNTYGDIKKALIGKSRDNFKGNGFFMSNSPIVLNEKVQTLAPCHPKTTAKEAQEEGNYAIVYLERILGKVEVKSDFGAEAGWTYTVPTSTVITGGDAVTFTAWGLDVTNTKTYPVRQVNDKWIGYANGGAGTATTKVDDLNYGKNRFIGADNGPQRIYYAIDPNYDNAQLITDFTTITDVTNSLSEVDYCLENTFDVANQIQNRTTRVVMKGQYKFSGQDVADFYRSSKSVIYKSEALLMGEMTKALANDTAVVVAFTKEDAVTGAKIATITYKKYKLEHLEGSPTDSIYAKNDDDKVYLADATYTASEAEVSAVNTAIGTLDYYKDGICYYVARIKHFGDILTPWNGTDNYLTGTAADYKDYLGRYGVVRNNWYELTISKVDKGPGEPTVPTPGPGQDDEQSYYIDAKIHILSWAKRYQGVEW